jgi:hypothetical protein
VIHNVGLIHSLFIVPPTAIEDTSVGLRKEGATIVSLIISFHSFELYLHQTHQASYVVS